MSRRRWAAFTLACLPLSLLLLILPAQAGSTDCNAVVSMSQGREVYSGQATGVPAVSPLEASTGEQWMLLWVPGKTLKWFTNSANWSTLTVVHRCGADVGIDSVVFIFDPFGSGAGNDDGATMRAHLGQVSAIVATRYPAAQVDLVMLVGAVGHVTCQVGGVNVRASKTHAFRIGQLAVASADLDVPCASYTDTLGHLSNAGATDANGQLADWFNAT